MIREFCDKCGQKMIGLKSINEMQITKGRNRPFRYDKKLNLCDECIKDLEVWLGKELKGAKVIDYVIKKNALTKQLSCHSQDLKGVERT